LHSSIRYNTIRLLETEKIPRTYYVTNEKPKEK